MPLQFGVFPFGLIYGVTAVNAGLTELHVFFSSTVLFAGASQLVFLQLFTQGVPAIYIASSVTLINLRHSLYGISLFEDLRHLPLRWRLLLAYLLTDEAYAVSVTYFQKNKSPFLHYHLFGSGLTLWTFWVSSTVLGAYMGNVIPEHWGLDFIIPLTFLAIIVPQINSQAQIIVAIVAAVMVALTYKLPYNLWLILSAISAIFVATIFEKWRLSR